VEANGVALSLQDGAFQVVVEDDPRRPLEGGEGGDVAPQETLEGLIQGEDRVQGPRPAQHQHEGGQPAGGAADRNRPEAAPIGLALLRWQHREPQVCLGHWRRPQRPDHAAQLHDGARIPPGAHHLKEPRGPEAGVALQGLLEERAIRVDLTGPDEGRPGEALGGQRPADGVGVQAELGGDGAHPPVLGEEEPTDLGDLLRGNHGRPPAASLRRRTGGSGGAPVWPLLVPADELAPAAAHPATGPRIGGGITVGGGWSGLCIAASWPAGRADHGHRRERVRQEDATGRKAGGSVMRHAHRAPRSVGPLAIAVVEPAFGALLMAPARGAETASAPFLAARRTAVGVPTITRTAEEERPPAEPAGPHPEDLHGPAGPEMSGGQWTTAQRCARTSPSRPRPRGVGAPEGPEVQLWALIPLPPGSRQPTRKLRHLPLYSRPRIRIYTLSGER